MNHIMNNNFLPIMTCGLQELSWKYHYKTSVQAGGSKTLLSAPCCWHDYESKYKQEGVSLTAVSKSIERAAEKLCEVLTDNN